MSGLVDRLRDVTAETDGERLWLSDAVALEQAAALITQLEADRAELVEALKVIAGRKWNTMTEGCYAACAAATDAKTTLAKMEARP
jgi:septal ring-binding cell division protein DamX